MPLLSTFDNCQPQLSFKNVSIIVFLNAQTIIDPLFFYHFYTSYINGSPLKIIKSVIACKPFSNNKYCPVFINLWTPRAVIDWKMLAYQFGFLQATCHFCLSSPSIFSLHPFLIPLTVFLVFCFSLFPFHFHLGNPVVNLSSFCNAEETTLDIKRDRLMFSFRLCKVSCFLRSSKHFP